MKVQFAVWAAVFALVAAGGAYGVLADYAKLRRDRESAGAALTARARAAVDVIENDSAATDAYRRALRSAGPWARDAKAAGFTVSEPPDATRGGAAVRAYYLVNLPKLAP